jgi:hypothetical protein
VSGSTTGTHYMLATLYTRNPDNSLGFIVAHDPWTGTQVAIDPASKTVISPSSFPLKNFVVDGYQPVVLN